MNREMKDIKDIVDADKRDCKVFMKDIATLDNWQKTNAISCFNDDDYDELRLKILSNLTSRVD